MDGVKVRHGPDTEEGPPEQHVFSDIFADAVYAWLVLLSSFALLAQSVRYIFCSVMSTK